MTGWRRTAAKAAAGAAIFALAVIAAAVLLVRSPWFFEQVRSRIVREIENATGGRVELAAFHFNWTTLRADVEGLVVHGLEPPSEPPLFAAERVSVGLRIISAFRRKVDLDLVEVVRPRISVTVDAEGHTNIPPPKTPRRGDTFQRFLNLAIKQYRVVDGEFRYISERIPLDAEGKNLDVQLSYNATGPSYQGHIETDALHVSRPLATPMALDLSADLGFDRNQLRISRANIGTGTTEVTAKGTVTDFSNPVGEFDVSGDVALNEIVAPLRLPIEERGKAHFQGAAKFQGHDWSSEGTFSATGVAYRHPGIAVSGISAEGPYRVQSGRLEAPKLVAHAVGGEFRGSAEILDWSRFHVKGNIRGFALDRINEARLAGPVVWSATAAGPVEVEGTFGRGRPTVWNTTVDVVLAPKEGGIPLAGAVGFHFDSRSNSIEFQSSNLEFPSSRVHFQGEIHEGMQVALTSRNLDDFLPALEMITDEAPKEMPATLVQGEAHFDGIVQGEWRTPVATGNASMGPFLFHNRTIRHVEAQIRASGDQVQFNNAVLQSDEVTASGSGVVGLDSWRFTPASTLAVKGKITDTPIQAVLDEAGLKLPLTGRIVAATADIQGTYESPQAMVQVDARQLEAWGETIEAVEGQVRYTPNRIDVIRGTGRRNGATFEITGSYEPRTGNWSSGNAQFKTSGRGWRLQEIAAVRERQNKINGLLSWTAEGTARVVEQKPELVSLNGELNIQQAQIEQRDVGNFTVTSRTQGRLMTVNMQANIRGAQATGSAEWSLGGNSYGLGQVQISGLTFDAMRELGILGDPDRQLPFQGSVQAEVGFSGPVLEPSRWTAVAKVTQFELEPDWQGTGPRAATPLIIRNQEPLLARVDAEGVTIESAHMVGDGTDLSVSGTVAFRPRSPWNLTVKGTVNLPVISRIEPNLLADGVSVVDATIRGSLLQPQVNGQLELRNASFYLSGLPNGIDQANGVILFDRTRATVERFRAQTGGGDITLSGFVGFGGDTPVYRLQATTEQVRVRYPEAVSTTFDSKLSLTGTAAGSLLSGSVTVTRMGITPKTDIGSLLVESGRVTSVPVSGNEFLRNMQLDVTVETSGDAEFQTSLTRDIQPEADLRLRGTAASPVLLGRVSVNQGEIQFFGNRYTITQGSVQFFNPVKIEPVLNLDLETRVRGITVTINFSGPIGKLNVTYRSDPPLQSSEIIALLTVGRAPGSAVTPTAPTSSPGVLQAGGNSLLGQAVAAPLSGRLQRLFGVSRLKIDPNLTGVTNTPQARLTIEQQLSRDITITYITNLNRTQQQIVRLEWDFSKDFSVVAVRDENGIFGIDFLYRRRFK